MASEENNKADLILFILDKLIKVSQFIIQAMPHLVRRKIGISIILLSGSTFSLSGSRCFAAVSALLETSMRNGFPPNTSIFFHFLAFVRTMSCKRDLPYTSESTLCVRYWRALYPCVDIMTSCTVSGIWCRLLTRVNCHSCFLSLFTFFDWCIFSTKGILRILQTHKQTASLAASVLDSVQSRWVVSFYM